MTFLKSCVTKRIAIFFSRLRYFGSLLQPPARNDQVKRDLFSEINKKIQIKRNFKWLLDCFSWHFQRIAIPTVFFLILFVNGLHYRKISIFFLSSSLFFSLLQPPAPSTHMLNRGASIKKNINSLPAPGIFTWCEASNPSFFWIFIYQTLCIIPLFLYPHRQRSAVLSTTRYKYRGQKGVKLTLSLARFRPVKKNPYAVRYSRDSRLYFVTPRTNDFLHSLFVRFSFFPCYYYRVPTMFHLALTRNTQG